MSEFQISGPGELGPRRRGPFWLCRHPQGHFPDCRPNGSLPRAQLPGGRGIRPGRTALRFECTLGRQQASESYEHSASGECRFAKMNHPKKWLNDLRARIGEPVDYTLLET
jgi:hypothetical protein